MLKANLRLVGPTDTANYRVSIAPLAINKPGANGVAMAVVILEPDGPSDWKYVEIDVCSTNVLPMLCKNPAGTRTMIRKSIQDLSRPQPEKELAQCHCSPTA